MKVPSFCPSVHRAVDSTPACSACVFATSTVPFESLHASRVRPTRPVRVDERHAACLFVAKRDHRVHADVSGAINHPRAQEHEVVPPSGVDDRRVVKHAHVLRRPRAEERKQAVVEADQRVRAQQPREADLAPVLAARHDRLGREAAKRGLELTLAFALAPAGTPQPLSLRGAGAASDVVGGAPRVVLPRLEAAVRW